MASRHLEVLNGLSIYGVKAEFRPTARALVLNSRPLRRYEATFIGWQLSQQRANTEILKLNHCELDDESLGLVMRGVNRQAESEQVHCSLLLAVDSDIYTDSWCLQEPRTRIADISVTGLNHLRDRSVRTVSQVLCDPVVVDNLRLKQFTIEFEELCREDEMAMIGAA